MLVYSPISNKGEVSLSVESVNRETGDCGECKPKGLQHHARVVVWYNYTDCESLDCGLQKKKKYTRLK